MKIEKLRIASSLLDDLEKQKIMENQVKSYFRELHIQDMSREETYDITTLLKRTTINWFEIRKGLIYGKLKTLGIEIEEQS